MYYAMKKYKIRTASSIWIFDLWFKRYLRGPVDPTNATHPYVEYTYMDEWDDFEYLSFPGQNQYNANTVVIKRAPPYQPSGYRFTGTVISGLEELKTAYKKLYPEEE